jgi:hypothetical protein
MTIIALREHAKKTMGTAHSVPMVSFRDLF